MTAVEYRPISCTPSEELYAKIGVAAAVFVAVFQLGYLASSTPPYDVLGYLIGRDFLNTWMGRRIAGAENPAVWFDFETYNVALRELFGANFPEHYWSYPPHLLLFVWPFGYLPYLPAYLLWCAIGFVLYLLIASAGDHRPDRLLFLAVSPAVLFNIFAGQNGFLTAALLIGGLTLLDRRPILAGILFGLLTIKPQLGILIPIMLLLTGRWRSIAAALGTTITLAAMTSWMFGLEIWTEYVKVALPFQHWVMTESTGIHLAMMPTAFMNARVAGLPLEAAWIVQAVMSAFAAAAVVWTFWKHRDPALSIALLVTASFLVTPYAFNYDMVVFGWVVALLRGLEGNELWDHRLVLAVWTLPATTIILGTLGIPGSSLVLAAFAARIIWRLARNEQREGRTALGLTREPDVQAAVKT